MIIWLNRKPLNIYFLLQLNIAGIWDIKWILNLPNKSENRFFLKNYMICKPTIFIIIAIKILVIISLFSLFHTIVLFIMIFCFLSPALNLYFPIFQFVSYLNFLNFILISFTVSHILVLSPHKLWTLSDDIVILLQSWPTTIMPKIRGKFIEYTE